MQTSFLQGLGWLVPLLTFFLGVIVTRWLLKHKNANQNKQVNQEYFKGLNFLLNEEPDKAIEVFIKALEVDSETVELHLALGGLFRRKGQVDRATRIHQNLIARTTLTQEQRLQAIYELAQDYYKAGLLDRAENLFLELKDSVFYRYQAIEGLSRLYQKEKEWSKAIEVTRLHKRADRSQYTRRISHYWCELATLALANDSLEDARKYLRSALNEDRSAARPLLLRGELSFKSHDYAKAIKLWQSLAVSHPGLAELVVDKMIRSYQQLEDPRGLKDYLLNFASIPKESSAFERWLKSLVDVLGEEAALKQIFEQLKAEGLSHAVSDHLYQMTDEHKLSNEQQQSLVKELLNRAKRSNIEYTCVGCGFDTKAMHWYCPNCGEWDSFS